MQNMLAGLVERARRAVFGPRIVYRNTEVIDWLTLSIYHMCLLHGFMFEHAVINNRRVIFSGSFEWFLIGKTVLEGKVHPDLIYFFNSGPYGHDRIALGIHWRDSRYFIKLYVHNHSKSQKDFFSRNLSRDPHMLLKRMVDAIHAAKAGGWRWQHTCKICGIKPYYNGFEMIDRWRTDRIIDYNVFMKWNVKNAIEKCKRMW